MTNRRFIDLNSKFIEAEGSPPFCKEPSDEFWQNDFRSTDGLHTLRLPISPLRGTLQRSLQSQKFFLLGSVSNFGLCPTDLSRESQGHRNVPSYHSTETLSHGHSQHCVAQHFGQRQSSSRLAHLRRLCPNFDPGSTHSVQRRTLWARTRAHGLCPRCHHRRFVFVAFSLGAIPPTQVRGQTAHAARSARQYSFGGDRHRGT